MKLFLSRKWGCLMLLPLAASLYAQKDLKTRATQVGIDERGYYQYKKIFSLLSLHNPANVYMAGEGVSYLCFVKLKQVLTF